MPLKLNINDEIGRLRSVVLGSALSNGPTPKLQDAYDPKSAEHIKSGTYPLEKDMILEMEALANVFERYQVAVFVQKLSKIITKYLLAILHSSSKTSSLLPIFLRIVQTKLTPWIMSYNKSQKKIFYISRKTPI